VVVDGIDNVIGIVSLSDILNFMVIKPAEKTWSELWCLICPKGYKKFTIAQSIVSSVVVILRFFLSSLMFLSF